MKNEIFDLEKKYWNAMSKKDYETMRSLTKFPCIVAGRRGVASIDESSFKKMFEQGSNKTMKVKSTSDEQVQTGEDHAMIGYLIELDYDGQVMKCACTSTWIKENGGWVCAMHTESDLEDK
ncbi:nuclear transport factor 2 family protein [Chitinophaga sp. G-6-1-13]|uniref:Nuclear transport factor 2 family protein n=1 Tax=Chitinophaga fulva TaxID=2728842 RepID=A0A848GQM1_9BACT|nr:nuclear transport factor 2 family protein [Chitinophaga fulva]NML38178.1 nuclear transport factor 2 family protein [Chitinophaga fulva]